MSLSATNRKRASEKNKPEATSVRRSFKSQWAHNTTGTYQRTGTEKKLRRGIYQIKRRKGGEVLEIIGVDGVSRRGP